MCLEIYIRYFYIFREEEREGGGGERHEISDLRPRTSAHGKITKKEENSGLSQARSS